MITLDELEAESSFPFVLCLTRLCESEDISDRNEFPHCHIRFIICFSLPSISHYSYVLTTYLSFRSLLIASCYIALDCLQGKLPLTLNVLHLLDQVLSSILSRWPNHCIHLSCKCFSCSSILV